MTWQNVARRQGGVISRAQLLAAGLSRHQAATLLRTGAVVGVHPGVYRAAAAPETTAALHWRLPVTVPTDVDVTLRHPRSVQARTGVRVHRYGFTSQSVTQVDGLPITARATTIVDLARTEAPQVAQSLVDRSVQAGWITVPQLERAGAVGARRTGNGQLLRLVQRCESGSTYGLRSSLLRRYDARSPAQAESERILHRLLGGAGLRGWIPQYRVRLPSGFAFIDVAFPHAQVAIEVDGRQFHGSHSERFENDRSRQNALMQAGWLVLRFTWTMLVDQPDYVLREIRRAVDSHKKSA